MNDTYVCIKTFNCNCHHVIKNSNNMHAYREINTSIVFSRFWVIKKYTNNIYKYVPRRMSCTRGTIVLNMWKLTI